MRFNFIREGRRFFFITLVVKGRRCLLSRRVKDEIVELLPDGQRLKDHWATSHSRDAAVTASNFVIMPDHAHLLLIVDFGKRPDFDILDWIKHFMRETGDCGLWDDHLYFQLSFSLRQLKAIRRYIKMNPARAWWKESHRDMFIRRGGLRHEMLDPAFPWTAFGNLTLLVNPFLFQVRLTTKKTLPELEGEIAAAVEKARHGMVPVSGFISPGEKEFYRRLLAEPNARWVKMLPYGLPPRYDPSVEDSRHLAEGRELILSAFPPSVPPSPISRANCLAMNDRIAELCARASELGARHGQGPGGKPPNPRGASGQWASGTPPNPRANLLGFSKGSYPMEGVFDGVVPHGRKMLITLARRMCRGEGMLHMIIPFGAIPFGIICDIIHFNKEGQDESISLWLCGWRRELLPEA